MDPTMETDEAPMKKLKRMLGTAEPKTGSVSDSDFNDIKASDFNFPKEFFFGAASSAYQYEGAATEDGKGVSNWDQYTHRNPDKIKDGKNGDVAVDFYHRCSEDIFNPKYGLASLHVNAFRLSIAWTRILPRIEPFVTLFHWDIPQALEDEYGGFLNPMIIEDYLDYVTVCFNNFGGLVNYWITFNEPIIFTRYGYAESGFPGCLEDPGTNPYIVCHHLLLAHAKAVQLYRNKYKKSIDGKIGIALNRVYMIPISEKRHDYDAANRATDFQFGWFMNPITFGDYPESMKRLVQDRLPVFTSEESNMLKGSYDFLGLNYYTALYVADVPPSMNPNYTTDGCYKLLSRKNGIPIGSPTATPPMYVVPEMLEKVLIDIKEEYKDPLIYITENGTSDPDTAGIDDDQREDALKKHLFYLRKAKDAGVNVKGYFLWSFLDNFEWNSGYTVRFGICHVDFSPNGNLSRTLKKSGKWYKKFLSE